MGVEKEVERSSAPGEGALPPPTPKNTNPSPTTGLAPASAAAERVQSQEQRPMDPVCDLRQGWAPHLSRGWEGLRGPAYLDNTFLRACFSFKGRF